MLVKTIALEEKRQRSMKNNNTFANKSGNLDRLLKDRRFIANIDKSMV